MSEFTISIGLITYNRPEFLKEAVLSVLGQSYKNFELIIANDFPDEPVSFGSLGIETDTRIRIVNHSRNLGEIENMNSLLHEAKGDWFTWLGDDDLFHPELLMLAYETINKCHDNDIAGFFCDFSAANAPDNVFPLKRKQNMCVEYNTADFLADYLSRKISLIGCYGIMRLDKLKKIGGIPRLGNSFSPYADTLIPVLLSQHGKIYWLNEKLMFLRTHADSLSCKSDDLSAYSSAEEEYLKFLKSVCANVSLVHKENQYIAYMVKWFTDNELSVLSRTKSLSMYAVMKIFIRYQVGTNIPRLAPAYKMRHIVYMLKKIILNVIYEPYIKLRHALKCKLELRQ